MFNKKILAFAVLGLLMVFLASCAQPKREETPAAAPQPVPEVQKEVQPETAPVEAPKEAAVPAQINDIGEQMTIVDQTASEIDTSGLVDVDGAIADIESI